MANKPGNQVMKPTTQLQAIHSNLSSLIKSKANAMPRGFNETRFIQNCMCVLQDMDQEKLMRCTPVSVARTLLKGAFLGLDFFNKECYAIPYGNQLSFQTDYKGERKLAKLYSIEPIEHIYADVVREGDNFEVRVVDGKKTINHTPDAFSDGEINGAYAVVVYKSGLLDYEVMSRSEIETVRDKYSKQSRGQAWSNSFGEMCKKTVLRRLRKSIELAFDNVEQQQIYQEDAADVEFKPRKTKPEVEAPIEIEAQFDEVPDSPGEPIQDDNFVEGDDTPDIPEHYEKPISRNGKPITDKQMAAISKILVAQKDDGTKLRTMLDRYKVEGLEELSLAQGSEIIKELTQNA